MELRHLRYFLAVADSASVRLASERLHISQPAVSRQIQDLEEELGFVLFSRSPRGLKLTPAGEHYLQDVRQTMVALDLAARHARSVAQGARGRLRLGYVENAGWDGVVPTSLNRFQQAVPDVGLELASLNSPEQLSALATASLDGGFIYRYGTLPDGLDALPLLVHDLVLAVPRAWHIDHDEAQPFDLHELAHRPFVMFPRAIYPEYYDRLMGACEQVGIHLDVVQEQPTEAAMLSLVCAGIGAAIVNSANLGRPPALARFFRLKNFSVSMPLVFVWRREADNPVLARFVETLRAMIG